VGRTDFAAFWLVAPDAVEEVPQAESSGIAAIAPTAPALAVTKRRRVKAVELGIELSRRVGSLGRPVRNGVVEALQLLA
jgi:hypothetical protein